MKSSRKKLGEAGLVSIIVTTIMMILITLIVLGFARLGLRNQRQSLDNQLSTQAFYAAESGVNDALNALKNNVGGVATNGTDYTQNCTKFMQDAGLTPGNELDSANIQYSCLLVDNTPASLEYSNIQAGRSVVAKLDTGGIQIDKINLSWRPVNMTGHADGVCPSAPALPATWPAGCKNGILRFDLEPYSSGGQTFWNTIERAYTGYMYPAPSGGGNNANNTNYNKVGNGFNDQGVWLAGQGEYVPGRCDHVTEVCTVTINVASIPAGTDMYIRIGAMYNPIAVTLTADGPTGILDLIGVQTAIDVTGKAADVLRRIQVRSPVNTFGDIYPQDVLQTSESLCKRLLVHPGDPTPVDVDSSDPACQVN